MKDNWTEAAFDMKEATSDNNLKLKNFRPLEMRQVEYFGEIITIPAHHKWVTTDDTGYVASWENEPDEQHGVWDYADDSGIEIPFFVGEFDPIDENDAIETLRHYPVEETINERQLDLAEAQLLGYAHCRDGYNLAALVDAMGLTPAEWQELQDKYAMYYLSDDDRSVIAQQLKQRE